MKAVVGDEAAGESTDANISLILDVGVKCKAMYTCIHHLSVRPAQWPEVSGLNRPRWEGVEAG